MLMQPTPPTDLNQLPPAKAIVAMRIIWAALLMGQLFFMGVITVILHAPDRQPHPPQPVLAWAALGLFLTAVPITFLVRRWLLGKARVNGIVPAAAYSTANIIFWAGCEGPSFFSLIVALINRSFWPTILITAAAMLLQVLTFPKLEAIQAPDTTFKID